MDGGTVKLRPGNISIQVGNDRDGSARPGVNSAAISDRKQSIRGYLDFAEVPQIRGYRSVRGMLEDLGIHGRYVDAAVTNVLGSCDDVNL